ncbi:MAG: protein containing Coagulation factor 5/8 type, partial [Chthoniobacteraceae bacterium]
MKLITLLALSAAAHAQVHRFEPLPPAESAKLIHLPPGYRAEVIASEPMIQEPVWAAWDGDGALYVAEMNSYMQDTKGTGTKTERNGRIKRLVDLDGDGVMDRATVFIDRLLLPRMILALDERILVQETDDTSLFAYRDTDGDGVADEKTLMWKGNPASASVEHQDSALTWNLDNWIYTAQGGRRHRFTRGKWETERVLEEFNQWGMGMDDTGTLFFSQNSIPGRGFNQPWHEWSLIGERLKWKRFARPSLGPETDEAFQLTYRAQPIGDRADVCEKSWTSACGLSIYRGDALPECRGDLFLAEPCGHAVRRGVVAREADGRLTLRNPHENAEFFMSEDFYCRPISTHTGPDGCLYVVDMYRGMIQDAPWVSPAFAERITAMGADAVK